MKLFLMLSAFVATDYVLSSVCYITGLVNGRWELYGLYYLILYLFLTVPFVMYHIAIVFSFLTFSFIEKKDYLLSLLTVLVFIRMMGDSLTINFKDKLSIVIVGVEAIITTAVSAILLKRYVKKYPQLKKVLGETGERISVNVHRYISV